MYEGITFEGLMNRMLKSVTDKNPGIDTREGSIIWDALAPAAIELVHLYIQLDVVLDQTFADTASREYLIMRCSERGIAPYPATHGILKGVFNVDVPIESRFSLDTMNYKTIEKISSGVFKMQCETVGEEGNRHFGTLIPIDYIDGLQTAVLTELLIPGEDPEETEMLRNRYFDSFDSQAYGGNIKDYKERTNAIPGVGGVKVYPVWNGGGSVKLVIINSNFLKPAEELVSDVQKRIHPLGVEGLPELETSGTGIAPIGHVVTVFGVENEIIDIEVKLTYDTDWQWEDVKQSIKDEIDAYFIELGKAWENEQNLVVRVSQIELRLLNLPGIIDVSGTKLNGLEQNVALGVDVIPTRGDVHGLSI